MAVEISASFVEMVFLICSVMLAERIELHLHITISIDHNYDISACSYAQRRNAYNRVYADMACLELVRHCLYLALLEESNIGSVFP